MPTTANGIPYVSSSDYVSNWPTVSQTLANKIDPAYGATRRLAYQTRTSTYAASSSTVSGASDVFSTDLTFTAAGSTSYLIEWWFPYFEVGTSTVPRLHLVDGSGTDLGWLAVYTTGITLVPQGSLYYTPSAGSISLNIRGTNGGSGSGNLGAGAGGAGAYMPGWMAVYGPPLTA